MKTPNKMETVGLFKELRKRIEEQDEFASTVARDIALLDELEHRFLQIGSYSAALEGVLRDRGALSQELGELCGALAGDTISDIAMAEICRLRQSNTEMAKTIACLRGYSS